MNIFRNILVKKLHISYNTYYKYRDYVRNIRILTKYGISQNIKHKDSFFFIIDPQIPQPGFADRIKAIVYAAHKAKTAGLKFYIIWNGLDKYLLPNNENDSDWRATMDDLEYSFKYTKIWDLYNTNELSPLIKNGKQYHCRNYMGNMSPYKFEDNGDLWYEEYNRLFKKSPILNEYINATKLEPREYVAVHLRFVNALETVEKDFNNQLSEEAQIELINRCKKAIRSIVTKHHEKKIVVFSDSRRFLETLNDINVIVLNSNNIGHIGMYNNNYNTDMLGKTILDFYMISRSYHVYSIGCKEIYANSGFPQIAALMGNIPFERIEA